MQSVYECLERTCEKLGRLRVDLADIKGAVDEAQPRGNRTKELNGVTSTLCLMCPQRWA